MDELLILNKLPLPKGFNGHQWNSKTRSKRSSMPKYLISDLPKLQHTRIKKLLQQSCKINYPPISFFDTYIRKAKKQKVQKINKERKQLQSLKQQFQYALMMSDRESNVFDQLLDKSSRMNISKEGIDSSRSKPLLSERKTKRQQNQRFFQNTMDLVIRHRKRQLFSNKIKVKEQDL